jgi:hypothetical protein
VGGGPAALRPSAPQPRPPWAPELRSCDREGRGLLLALGTGAQDASSLGKGSMVPFSSRNQKGPGYCSPHP